MERTLFFINGEDTSFVRDWPGAGKHFQFKNVKQNHAFMNPRSVGRFAVCALLVALFTGCHSTRSPAEPRGPHLRVLTYNLNWGGPDAGAAAEIIRRSGADVVCLQETTPEWERLLREALRSEYPFAEFRSSKMRAGGGLAFLARKRGREVAYIPSDTGWFDGWMMAFDSAVGPVQILNVHLRPPVSDRGGWVSGYFTTREDRVRELERFYARRQPALPVLVAGDFNDGEDSRAVRWLERQGLINALPQFDRSTATWHWRVGAVTLRRRMDHILAAPVLQCRSARVIPGGASDHFAVEAVFVRAPEQARDEPGMDFARRCDWILTEHNWP